MIFIFPHCRIRASIRTFNPRQLKYEDKSDTKFKFATFNKNVARWTTTSYYTKRQTDKFATFNKNVVGFPN